MASQNAPDLADFVRKTLCKSRSRAHSDMAGLVAEIGQGWLRSDGSQWNIINSPAEGAQWLLTATSLSLALSDKINSLEATAYMNHEHRKEAHTVLFHATAARNEGLPRSLADTPTYLARQSVLYRIGRS